MIACTHHSVDATDLSILVDSDWYQKQKDLPQNKPLFVTDVIALCQSKVDKPAQKTGKKANKKQKQDVNAESTPTHFMQDGIVMPLPLAESVLKHSATVDHSLIGRSTLCIVKNVKGTPTIEAVNLGTLVLSNGATFCTTQHGFPSDLDVGHMNNLGPCKYYVIPLEHCVLEEGQSLKLKTNVLADVAHLEVHCVAQCGEALFFELSRTQTGLLAKASLKSDKNSSYGYGFLYGDNTVPNFQYSDLPRVGLNIALIAKTDNNAVITSLAGRYSNSGNIQMHNMKMTLPCVDPKRTPVQGVFFSHNSSSFINAGACGLPIICAATGGVIGIHVAGTQANQKGVNYAYYLADALQLSAKLSASVPPKGHLNLKTPLAQ